MGIQNKCKKCGGIVDGTSKWIEESNNTALDEVYKFIKENFETTEVYCVGGFREVEYFDGSVETVFTPTIILKDVERVQTVSFEDEMVRFKKKGL